MSSGQAGSSLPLPAWEQNSSATPLSLQQLYNQARPGLWTEYQIGFKLLIDVTQP